MLITVGDALGFEIFQRSQARLVAGSAGLDREIRWVHAAEVPEIADLLVGGELLLTTGMGLGDPRLQKRFIRDLAGVGVAGVVLQLGRTFGQVPSTMVSTAETCRTPLIVLPHKTRFVEITQQLHSAIISHEYKVLEKAEKVGREFTELVLQGGGLRQIIHLLAGIVENPVILEDSAHQLIEFAVHGGTVNQVLRTWEVHSRRGHAQDRKGAGVHVQEGDPSCAWAPIILSNEVRARLHVLALDRPLNEMDEQAIDRAAAALGVALLVQNDAGNLVNHAREGLLIELLNHRYGSASEFLQRAKSVGADLESRHLVPLVVEALDMSESDETALPQEDRQGIVAAMLEEVNIATAGTNCAGLSAVEGDRVLVLVGLADDEDVDYAAYVLGLETCRRLAARLHGIEPVVGLSGEASLDSLGQAFDEAREAVRYGIQVVRKTGVYHFGELGLRTLLLRLSEGPELARFIERELGPLLDHDASHAMPLLKTLRAYVTHGGNKARTAHALNLERHSLYYRLDRIARLLGRDLEDPAACVCLSVAVQGLDVLQGLRGQLR